LRRNHREPPPAAFRAPNTSTWGRNALAKGRPGQADTEAGFLGAKAPDETILGGRRSRFETVAACSQVIILEACHVDGKQ
jgi:hypothetical protein